MMSKAGREEREQGGVWRVHAVFDLPAERFSAFELTDEREGERIDRAEVVPGEIRIADRAYLHADRIATVLAAGADVIVRAPWNGASWRDANGNSLDLIEVLKRAGRKQIIDRAIFMKGSPDQLIAVRLVALRKPKHATEETIAKLRREAARKGKAVHPSTLVAAGWTILITSLAKEAFPAQKLGALYRLRWRIEIAFKHAKSGIGLVRPPGEDPGLAKVHILCHLLAILLTEPLLAEHLGDSPRRAAA
jgi:IS4 transposase